MITFPLLRLGRLQLGPGLRALRPGSAASGLVVTAAVPVPDSSAEPQYAWDVAWADAAREAGRLGADQATAQALPAGAGDAFVGGTRIVVAAHGEVLLALARTRRRRELGSGGPAAAPAGGGSGRGTAARLRGRAGGP